MDPWMQYVLTIVTSVLASSGFWAYFQTKRDKQDSKTELLIGLAHNEIINLGMKYIERGWITQDEYENFYEYLYIPYEKAGGNGSAKRVMLEVNKLPIHSSKHRFKED